MTETEELGLIALGLIVLFIPFWKLLRKRLGGLETFTTYCGLCLVALTVIDPSDKPSDWWLPWFGLFTAAVSLLAGWLGRSYRSKQKAHSPSIDALVVAGDWNALAKMGIPEDGIGKLKRLSPQERAALMRAIRRPAVRTDQPGRRDEDDLLHTHLINSGLHCGYIIGLTAVTSSPAPAYHPLT